jgi:tetratricopeptide (TPR) repeat protein
MKKRMKNRTRIHSLLLFVSVIVMTGCDRSKDKVEVDNITVTECMTLLKSDRWTIDDRHKFVNLMSVNALNKLLNYFQSGTVDEFYNQYVRTGVFKNTKFDKMIDEAEAASKVENHPFVVSQGWKIKGKSTVLAYYVIENNRIKDLQLFKAKMVSKKFSLPIFLGVLLGGLFFVIVVFGNSIGLIINFLDTTFENSKGCVWSLVGIILVVVSVFSGIVRTYSSISGDRFNPTWIIQEKPYPGPFDKTYWEASRSIVSNEILQMKLAASSDPAIAASFSNRGRILVLKSDTQSLVQAVDLYQRSLKYRFDAGVIIDLANALAELAVQGIKPELNMAKAQCILASPVCTGRNLLYSQIVLSKILAQDGKIGTAKNQLNEVKESLPKNEEMNRDMRRSLLESQYLTELDWGKRIQLADELIRTEPNAVKYYYYKGIADLKGGNPSVGRQAIERARFMNEDYALSTPEQHILDYDLKTNMDIENRSPAAMPIDLPFKSLDAYENLYVFLGKTEAIAIASDGSLQKKDPRASYKNMEAGRSFSKKGMIGVLKMRQPETYKTASIVIFCFLVFLIFLILVGVNSSLGSERKIFVFLISLISFGLLYWAYWGISGTGSWIWLIILSAAGGTVQAALSQNW